MDIEMVDVTLHFADPLERERLQALEDGVHRLQGVVSTHVSKDNPRMMMVELNPRQTSDRAVLEYVQGQGVTAELTVPAHL